MRCHLRAVIAASLLLCNVAAAAGNARTLLRTPSALTKQTLVSKVALPEFRQDQRGLPAKAANPYWTKPTWWRSYRKKFLKRRLKKCIWLYGVAPATGTACPSKHYGDWYMCMFGNDQTCDASTGPLPDLLSAYTADGLGGVHPATRCICKDLVWICEDWKPCTPPAPDAAANVYRSQTGALNVTLRLFSKEVIKGYDYITDADLDLAQAAAFAVNQAIEQNKGIPKLAENPEFVLSENGPVDDGASVQSTPLASSSQTSASGQTDFETNNQEEGVDEADAVKSDGKYVYAAYGEMIVVWDALSGDLITNVTMPAIETTNEPTDTSTNDVVSPGGIIADSLPGFVFFQPKPSIRALLLESNRLVVIVEGYGSSNLAKLNITYQDTVLSELLATHVRVYDTSSLDTTRNLRLVKAIDMNGSYRDARAVGDNVHVVTSSYVNSYYWLYEPLQRWNNNFAPDLPEEDYKAQAATLAKDKLIPAFVDQVMKDITMFGTPKLVKISLWESILSGMENTLFSSGVFQAYSQVASFAVTDADLTLSLSGSFMPSSYGFVYSTPEMLILSAEGWDWLPSKNATGPTTYFLGMKLSGATATPAAVGSLPGSLINQYSLDIFDGHLRAATTIPTLWRWPEFAFDGGDLFDFRQPEAVSSSENQVVILKIPDLGVAGEGLMSEVSRISNLGKVGESFTAIRFFDNVAYAVTFLRTDPFYVLDLTVTNPRVLGELEITGFSSYLHSINDANTLILAVGEEADADGLVLGLKISLFDSADPVKPTLLQSFTVEQSRDTWSSSAVSWDFKAFRYLSLGTEVGILIIPVQVTASFPSTEGNFDGFITYDISRQGISQRGDIPHVDTNDFFGCYSDAYLPQRSLVFNGNVTTLKGHSVVSTDLDTFKTTWELQLDEGVDVETSGGCFFWF